MKKKFIKDLFGDEFESIFFDISGIEITSKCLYCNEFFFDDNSCKYFNSYDVDTLKFIYPDYASINFLLKFPLWFWVLLAKVVRRRFCRFRSCVATSLDKRIAIIPSCNGIVVINFTDGLVYKILSPASAEPNFLSVEKRAQKEIPEHMPGMISSGCIRGKYAFMVSEYISKSKIYSFVNWGDALGEINPILFKQYDACGLQALTLYEYVNEIRQGFETCHNVLKFRDEIKVIENSFFDFMLKFDSFHDEVILYKVHAHGDLVPNNVIFNNGKKYIFDWASGGWLNILYDLMIQEFYFPNSYFWRHFFELDRQDIFGETCLSGWGEEYMASVEKVCGESLNVQQIKLSCLIALAEKSINTCLRYQFNENEEINGQGMMNNILAVFRSIRSSQV